MATVVTYKYIKQNPDIMTYIRRTDHAQSGAVMAFRLLDKLSMPAEEICSIVSAIGNHDEAAAPFISVA